jgi:NADPH oxidase
VSVHIRQVGDFTKALGARLGATVTPGSLPGGEKRELDQGGEKGRRGDFVEVNPAMGKGMPVLRIDG